MASDAVAKILNEAFDEAYPDQVSADVERFVEACRADPRVSNLTTAHYADVLGQFRRFVRYGTRRFS